MDGGILHIQAMCNEQWVTLCFGAFSDNMAACKLDKIGLGN